MKIKKLNEFLFCGGYPIIIVFAYVLIGSFLNIWHPTWLLFLTIPVYYMLVVFAEDRDWNVFPYPILCVILFLVTGFDYNIWHPMWIIFLTIPIYYIAINVREK